MNLSITRSALTTALGAMLFLALAARAECQVVEWEEASGGNGHRYEAVLVPEGITWDQARDAAEARLGDWHLATITSEEENAFVYALIDDPAFWNCCLSGNSRGPWLGGISSCISCNDWQWITGEAWTFENWAPFEPLANGDRLGFFGYNTLMSDKWNDLPEHYVTYGYVVETSAPWVDVGGGTAGVAGPPMLELSGPLTPASTLTLDLVNGPPSALALLFISFSSTPTPFLGGVLHAFPFDELLVIGTDPTGEIHGAAAFPTVSPGLDLWFQVGMADASVPVYGASLSNSMRGTVP